MFPKSIPGVVDVEVFGGAANAHGGAIDKLDILIEVPHGATTTADYDAIANAFAGTLPANLVDFFRVNTDIGAPELARALAAHLVAEDPTLVVLVLRARVPRTFVDFNRRIDASEADFKAGGVGPGLMPWVTESADREALVAKYNAWFETVSAAADRLAPNGLVVSMHTYAPKSVGVSVDHAIVESLHAAYQPDVYATWPERPQLDLIARAPDGTRVIPDGLFDAISARFASLGITPGDSATYRMHPSTLGAVWAERFPGRALCPEFRRDLLVEDFSPFAEQIIDEARVKPLATALGDAIIDFRRSDVG